MLLNLVSVVLAYLLVWSACNSVCCQEMAPQAQLRGLAEFQQVSVKANPMASKIFASCRPSAFRCVQVEVANNLATPIMIDGDQALASGDGQSFSQATEAQIVADSGCNPSAFAKALVAAAGLSSAGLALPIASEMANKPKNLGVPCGGDVLRHSVEEMRLGKRLLAPGDKTSGLLCFLVPATVAGNLDVKITIPVVTKAPEVTSGEVEVQTSLLK